MLIQSSFSDYYDGVASSGIDTTICYHRETSTTKGESSFLLNHLPQHLPDAPSDFPEGDYSHAARPWIFTKTCHFQIIGFCGTQIVVVSDRKTAYFGEEILTLNWSKQKRTRKPSNLQIVIECIQRFNGKADNTLFQKFNVPIFITDVLAHPTNYEFRNPGLYLPGFTLNPNLKDLQFQKHKDAYSTFQDLQSYISGILGITTPETIELSDRFKILKAGFDPKISFRKGKQPKK